MEDDSQYINHSAEPNIETGMGPPHDEYTQGVIYARRDLAAGEEIFENYNAPSYGKLVLHSCAIRHLQYVFLQCAGATK